MSGQATAARDQTRPGVRAPRRAAGPRGVPAAAPAAASHAETATAAGLLALFLVALCLPVEFEIGGQRLSPIRLFLLVSFIPLLVRLLKGEAGRLTAGDICFGLHGLWIGVAMFAVHGPSRMAFAGISIVEALGSYLVGRVLVRNVTDYHTFFRYFLIALAVLAPFVLFENVTGRLLLSEILRPLAGTLQKVQAGAENMRMGFFRAQGVVEHPIIWGVFCSIGIANVYYLYRDRRVLGTVLTGFNVAMTFTSLSSGPLLSAMLQIGMIGWGWITRNAWWVLIGLFLFVYVAIDMVSNRAPLQVIVSYLTFSPRNAYWRMHIFNYGSAEVLRHPLFGIGLNDWVRPGWLASASVDNFWLNTAMRYGFPGLLTLVAGILLNLAQILRNRALSERLRMVRSGHVIALVGTLMALTTVHVWGAPAVLVLFYMGAGCWLFTSPSATGPSATGVEAPAAAGTDTPARPRIGYARQRAADLPDQPVAPPASPSSSTSASMSASTSASTGRPAGSGSRSPTAEERMARRRAQYSGHHPGPGKRP